MADFDPAKDAINQAKHGISLARWVDMEIRAVVPVEPFDYGEPRYRAFGFIDGLAYCLVFTTRNERYRPNHLYGGMVPHLFMKTKAITHGLVDGHAEGPTGWSTAFAERLREIVLPGYTAFSNRDARLAATRLLTRGPIRLKKPLSASGKDQSVLATLNELDAALEKVRADEMATYGLVLEQNLREVRTFSVGQVAVGNLRISYHGIQRTVRDNEGRPVYGGSDLVCVRGGWESLDALQMSSEVRAAVIAARLYDEATEEFCGFLASRRNYDVVQGIAADDRPLSGVLEASWRVGGASSGELAAMTAFACDPELRIIRVSHVEEYGKGRRAPADAIIDFQGEDPEAGPLLRYTIVKPQERQSHQNICVGCDRRRRGLPPPGISYDPANRVVRFDSRKHASRPMRKALIAHCGPDYSPVPDLSKYEYLESDDEYQHRMMVNAIALIFVSVLSVAGLWLVNAIAHS